MNKNNIGTITGIVTTTLGDVEGAAPVALVSVVGGFLNSVILVLFLLILKWRIGLLAQTVIKQSFVRAAVRFPGARSSAFPSFAPF